MEETKEQGRPNSSVALLKSVVEIAIANRAIIDDKFNKMTATIDLVNKKIPEIADDKQDAYISKLIVMGNEVMKDGEIKRKEYTRPLDNWIAGEIAPENNLKALIAGLTAKRNARATRLKAEADKKLAEINLAKEKKNYEIEVKKLLKVSVESGAVQKLVEFEESISQWFMKAVRHDNEDAVTAKLKTIKPKLAEDFFVGLFQIDFNNRLMSQDEYDDLVKRAKTFWVYETINATFVTSAQAIAEAWVEKIPQRVKELKIINEGGDQAERVKKIVDEREANETEERRKIAAGNLSAITTGASQEAQGETMSAEFQAQVQTQSIEQPSGTREKDYFVLDEPVDLLRLSKIIGALIVNIIPTNNAELRRRAIFAVDREGNQKYNLDGSPIYSDGVQFWLTIAASIPNLQNQPGLSKRKKVTTIAKK